MADSGKTEQGLGEGLDLAAAVAAEARALFANLPEDEILEDERLYFAVADGMLTLWVPRTNYNYTYRHGRTWRYQQGEHDETELAVFERGRLVETLYLNLEAGARSWASYVN